MAEHAITPAPPQPAATWPVAKWPVEWQPVWGDQDGLLDRAANLALSGLFGTTAVLPEPVLELLLDASARVAFRLDRPRRRAAHAFLRQALGELAPHELDRLTLRSWRHFLRVLCDTRRFLRQVPRERVLERFEVLWTPEVQRVLSERRGAVIVTGHVGNWEAGLAALGPLGFGPVYAVARPPKNRPLSRTVQAERERLGIRMLHRKGAMRAAPRILAAGGSLALVLDHRTSGRSFLAPFFGRLARCDRSAGVLLQRQRVPVVVASCVYTGRPLRYRAQFHEVLWPEQWSAAGLPAIVARINQALERVILAHPEQYFWLHDRYRDTPGELPAGRHRLVRPAPASGPSSEET
jgi:KDO2-lipid IV(A) lauroyltransferase